MGWEALKMILKLHVVILFCEALKMILKCEATASVCVWGIEASSQANEAGFCSTAVRPKAALSGAGGAGAIGGRAARGAASEQTRMACRRMAAGSTSRSRYGVPEKNSRSEVNLRCNCGFNRLSSAK